jgi:hypothetical protein
MRVSKTSALKELFIRIPLLIEIEARAGQYLPISVRSQEIIGLTRFVNCPLGKI